MTFHLAAVLSRLETFFTSDHGSVVSISLFVTLLCACIVVGHLLEENRWMNESITALAIVSPSIDDGDGCFLSFCCSNPVFFS